MGSWYSNMSIIPRILSDGEPAVGYPVSTTASYLREPPVAASVPPAEQAMSSNDFVRGMERKEADRDAAENVIHMTCAAALGLFELPTCGWCCGCCGTCANPYLVDRHDPDYRSMPFADKIEVNIISHLVACMLWAPAHSATLCCCCGECGKYGPWTVAIKGVPSSTRQRDALPGTVHVNR